MVILEAAWEDMICFVIFAMSEARPGPKPGHVGIVVEMFSGEQPICENQQLFHQLSTALDGEPYTAHVQG